MFGILLYCINDMKSYWDSIVFYYTLQQKKKYPWQLMRIVKSMLGTLHLICHE